MKNLSQPKILNHSDFSEAKTFSSYTAENSGTALLFLPLTYQDEIQCYLCLERWQNAEWSENDLMLCKSLLTGYGQYWYWIGRKAPSLVNSLKQKFTSRRILILSAIICILLFIPAPLRITAPCEIIPDKPVSITARINGVINRIPVRPGDTVTAGTKLVLFDQTVIYEELKEARQQVEVITEKLLRIQSAVFDNPAAKGELAILRAQLEQSRARLALSEYYAAQSTISAPVSGCVLLNNPDEWEGRPVRVGERIMQLFNPRKNRLLIELPQDDRINFPDNARVKIILSSDSTDINYASLSYVAGFTRTSADGRTYFPAEAEWQQEKHPSRIGLRGTAIIYGDTVSLWQLILRKPLAWLRNSTGL